ncbi:MAG: Jag N-terminal domain-containing protein [Chloroflexota bacterium]|nr:Jag N-terminal domain-containing protein [Chloroflexota bacterium]
MANNSGNGVIVTGGTVEDAVKRALLQLNVTLDEIDVEVLSSGSRGVLGMGREDARVRVTVRSRPYSEEDDSEDEESDEGVAEAEATAPDEEPPAEDAAAVTAEAEAPGAAEEEPAAEQEPAAEEVPEAEEVPVAPPARRPRGELLESGEDLEHEAEELLESLLDRMGFMADFDLVSEDPLAYNIVGDDDFGRLIGRQGETLRAFGYLVNLMLGRRMGRPCRVIVDVNGYRQRRADQLAELAETLADEVRATQEPITLEAMPANERRLVHVALADDEDVRTYSIGEGDERRVVISPRA